MPAPVALISVRAVPFKSYVPFISTPTDFEISPISVPPASMVVAPVYVLAPVRVNVFNLYF